VDVSRLSRGRLAALLAPGSLAWAQVLWIFLAHALGMHGQWHLIATLRVFQIGLMLAGIGCGVAAFWLPSRALRLGVATWSLAGVAMLYQVLLAVMFGPGA